MPDSSMLRDVFGHLCYVLEAKWWRRFMYKKSAAFKLVCDKYESYAALQWRVCPVFNCVWP